MSDWKRSEGKAGLFKHTAGKWSGDPDDRGNSIEDFGSDILHCWLICKVKRLVPCLHWKSCSLICLNALAGWPSLADNVKCLELNGVWSSEKLICA